MGKLNTIYVFYAVLVLSHKQTVVRSNYMSKRETCSSYLLSAVGGHQKQRERRKEQIEETTPLLYTLVAVLVTFSKYGYSFSTSSINYGSSFSVIHIKFGRSAQE